MLKFGHSFQVLGGGHSAWPARLARPFLNRLPTKGKFSGNPKSYTPKVAEHASRLLPERNDSLKTAIEIVTKSGQQP
jgi:hypothetical protein